MAKPSVPRKIAEEYVLKIIKENQPISVYRLGKILGYSYSGIRDYVKELIKKEKIKTSIILNENNRAERILFLVNHNERKK